LKDAVASASQKRITPILLTFLTTVFGLMPIAIAGGALWEPMAALMIGGVSVSSIITLFLYRTGITCCSALMQNHLLRLKPFTVGFNHLNR